MAEKKTVTKKTKDSIAVVKDPSLYEITQAKLKEFSEWLQKAESTELVVTPTLDKSESRVLFDGSTYYGSAPTNSDNIKQRIAACREAVDYSGIIGNVVDLMVDFALEGITISHEVRAIERFYRNWGIMVDLTRVCEQILLSYFRDGNVPILSIRGKIKQNDVKRWRKVFAKELGKSIGDAFSEDKIKKNLIPYAYRVLDVMHFDKDGSELLGGIEYKYNIASADPGLFKNIKSNKGKIAQTWKDAIGAGDFSNLQSTGYLPLDPDRISMIYYRKDDHKKWSNPMFNRVLKDLKFKELLRQMDISVAESVTNVLTFVCLGDTPAGYPPDPADLVKVASFLKNPSKSKTIVWSDLIKVVREYPPIDDILGKEKYEQVDNNIRAGIGVPEVLVNGGGGNYANSFISVKTLIERLESGRTKFKEWLEGETRKVAKALGFKKPPIVQLHHMGLTDADKERRLLLELVDRGILSYRTVAERFGENIDVEIRRMKEEDIWRKKNEEKYPSVIWKVGKFGTHASGGPISLFEDPESEMSVPTDDPPKTPESQEGEGDKGGRPVDTKQPQEKDGEKPRNEPQGSKAMIVKTLDPKVIEKAAKIFEETYNILASVFVSSKGYESDDDITDDEREKIYNSIIKFMSATNLETEVTKTNITSAITYDLAIAPAKLDRCVKQVKKSLVEKFKKKNKRSPSKEEMKDITSSAWAICTDRLK